MTKDELKKIEEEIALLEAEGKKISVTNKMKLKKLQRARDKAVSPIEPSSVFVSENINQKNIELIDIDKIIMPNFNDRTGIDNKKILELASSIKENGLIQPIVVIENDNSTYTKIAGRRRILAYIYNGKKRIEAIVKREKLDINQFNLLVLHENTQREDLSLYDKVRSILNFIQNELNISESEAKKILYKVNNLNKGNLAKKDLELEEKSIKVNKIILETKVFLSIQHLIKHLAVLEMSEEILALLDSNKITFGMALIFNKYQDKEFKKEAKFSSLVKNILDKEMSLKDAKDYLNGMIKDENNQISSLEKDIKNRLSKLNKIALSLDKDRQKSFHDELDKLLKKY